MGTAVTGTAAGRAAGATTVTTTVTRPAVISGETLQPQRGVYGATVVTRPQTLQEVAPVVRPNAIPTRPDAGATRPNATPTHPDVGPARPNVIPTRPEPIVRLEVRPPVHPEIPRPRAVGTARGQLGSERGR